MRSPVTTGEHTRPRDNRALHPERALVGVEQYLLLTARGGVELPQAHHLPYHLGVESGRLGLGIDLANVRREARALLFQAFDALDQRAQAVGGDAARIGPGCTLGLCDGVDASAARLWIATGLV